MASTKERQTTGKLLMVSPDKFGFNPETAPSNSHQEEIDLPAIEVRNRALKEFSGVVEMLKENGIEVIVLPSRKDVVTPDAIFPNNWVSFHSNGMMIIYPMLNDNRRAERQVENLQNVLSQVDIVATNTLDLSSDEEKGKILEGTGSVVLDRTNKVAFAIESPRTTKEEFIKYCQLIEFTPIFFHATDKQGKPEYHTNVIMSVGEGFAVICSESIKDLAERQYVIETLRGLDKQIIDISSDQRSEYCGNILQVNNKNGEKKIIMSQRALTGFTAEQQEILMNHGDIVAVNIPTIEIVGGGSARCMLAEVFI